jgi:hypothetical protein
MILIGPSCPGMQLPARHCVHDQVTQGSGFPKPSCDATWHKQGEDTVGRGSRGQAEVQDLGTHLESSQVWEALT